MKPNGEKLSKTSRDSQIRRCADKFDRREMEPHKAPKRGRVMGLKERTEYLFERWGGVLKKLADQ